VKKLLFFVSIPFNNPPTGRAGIKSFNNEAEDSVLVCLSFNSFQQPAYRTGRHQVIQLGQFNSKCLDSNNLFQFLSTTRLSNGQASSHSTMFTSDYEIPATMFQFLSTTRLSNGQASSHSTLL